MTLFVNETFWISALLAYLLIQTKLPLRSSLRYGLINAGILSFLLGLQITLAAISLTLILWGLLRVTLTYRNNNRGGLKFLAGTISLLFITLIFIFHKLNTSNESFFASFNNAIPWVRAELILPALILISFSYVFLRCIDLIRSIVWGETELLDPISLLGFILPFYMIVSGPINSYEEHLKINESPPNEDSGPHRIILIINEITTGLFYKFVIAEGIRIYFWGLGEAISINSWYDSAIFFIYLFFDFAGYSKVALGLGKLYRVPTPENFDSPFLSCSMTEFWTRWHMSLGNFVRKNIFFPIQLYLVRQLGRKHAIFVNAFTVIFSFGMVGLWHRFTWVFFAWGLAMGLVLTVEKFAREYSQSFSVITSPFFQAGVRVIGPAYVFIINASGIYFVANEIFVV